MTATVSHTARRSLIERELIWRIDGNLLQIGDDRFALADVVDIRIEWSPTMAAGSQYLCHISFRNGATFTMPSAHFRSFADFEARNATFRPFVLALASLVSKANPSCTFSNGASVVKFYANVVALGVSVLLLALIIMLVSPSWGKSLGLITLACIFAVPLSVSWFIANKPRSKPLAAATADGALERALPIL